MACFCACGVGCTDDALVHVAAFGDNPGALEMYWRAPTNSATDVPLVVFLHGCQQDHDVVRNAGLLSLADARNFAVLAPEQTVLNNAQRCFNWFEHDDVVGGESRSVRAMVNHLVQSATVDAGRIFIAGVSAGAAMAVAVVATSPDTFAAGASIAGGPFRCADSVADAPACLAGDAPVDADTLARRLLDALGDVAAPALLVVHGSDDHVVSPRSSDALARQWDSAGDVERITLQGVGHELPIDTRGGCGAAAPFMHDSGRCLLRDVVDFFGL